MQLTTIVLCLSMFFSQVHVVQTQYVDIVQTAINNGNFTILLTAIRTAGLVSALQGPGPFTVFAPTDGAFNKLPNGTLADLLKSENLAKLTRILKYHVIYGQNLTAAQINAMNLPTMVNMLDGGSITVSRNGSNLKVNDATVIIPNVFASNGVIHVIDTVLMPSGGLARSFFLNQSFFLILVLTSMFSYMRFG